MQDAKKIIVDALQTAGIKVNGSKPWDIKIHNENIYTRILRDGNIGIGEGYMAGEWDAKALDELVYKAVTGDVEEKILKDTGLFLKLIPQIILEKIKNKNPYEIAKKHYDLGNDLFTKMLDKRMAYTCGYWKNAKNLDEAQEHKLDLVCQKLRLLPGMRVLDIGGGWGSFAKYAAQKYKVHVVNITVSKEQLALANNLCHGLPVENRLQDYQSLNEKPYDRIVSIGMFEHVRTENYEKFMKIVKLNLKDDGLFLLHTIGNHITASINTSWTAKYIFPNSEIPAFGKLAPVIDQYFVVEDLQNFSSYYDKTLLSWFANFDKNYHKIKKEYGQKFYRMWKLYLLGSAAMFRARKLQLWQFVMSKKGVPGVYEPVR